VFCRSRQCLTGICSVKGVSTIVDSELGTGQAHREELRIDGGDAREQAPSMARKLRMEYPGSIYHLMNRSDRREAVFRDDQDRKRFISTLGEACQKTGWEMDDGDLGLDRPRARDGRQRLRC
jgi:hypothetical protein